MGHPAALDIDVVIFGGGVAGLWLLEGLREHGHGALLLETDRLGAGQTAASQGIIHGGLKYSLGGRRSPAAEAIRQMPQRWRESLAGRATPDLSGTRVRAESCWLWHTGSLRSRLGMLGARAGLQVRPVTVSADERPAFLAQCRGVARLDEQVIDPLSMLATLAARHKGDLLRIDAREGLSFEMAGPASVEVVHLRDPETDAEAILRPKHIVLCAGAGNGLLRRKIGLDEGAMQRRPLRMVMVRGPLPELAGHCIDGARTRLTITAARDPDDRVVWQVGGEVAETGVGSAPAEALAHARGELEAAIPGLDLGGCAWASYLVDRAEAACGGQRPDDVSVLAEGNVLTAWPTKLALAPRLVDVVLDRLGRPSGRTNQAEPQSIVGRWPRPEVACPPWETETTWTEDV